MSIIFFHSLSFMVVSQTWLKITPPGEIKTTTEYWCWGPFRPTDSGCLAVDYAGIFLKNSSGGLMHRDGWEPLSNHISLGFMSVSQNAPFWASACVYCPHLDSYLRYHVYWFKHYPLHLISNKALWLFNYRLELTCIFLHCLRRALAVFPYPGSHFSTHCGCVCGAYVLQCLSTSCGQMSHSVRLWISHGSGALKLSDMWRRPIFHPLPPLLDNITFSNNHKKWIIIMTRKETKTEKNNDQKINSSCFALLMYNHVSKKHYK